MAHATGTPAAWRFASNTVILRVLGEQVNPEPEHLRDLCLVNKLFHSEFVVYLHRKLDTAVERLDAESPHLVHTRTLIARTLLGPHDLVDGAFNKIVQRLLARMPRLEAFVWPSAFDLLPETLGVLRRSCGRVKGIHVDYFKITNIFPSEIVLSTLRFWRHDLSSFRDLRCLTLSEIGDELLAWRAQIVQILVASPALTALDLSISGMAIYRNHDRGIYDPRFFDRLCDDYAEAGGMPLKPRSLRCGHAIYPMSHGSLAKLVSLECLEEIAICNRNVAWGAWKAYPPLYPSNATDSRSLIAFGAFEPKHCPNLRRLAIHKFRLDAFELLCTIAEDKDLSKRLALCVGGMDRTSGDPSILFKPNPGHPGLPIQLRMVGFELGWQSNIDWYGSCDAEDVKANSVFNHLLVSNADSLEGMAVHLVCRRSQNPASVYMPLPVLESAVRRLPHLRQFAFNPFFSTKYWSLAEREIILEAAQRLAAAGPQLGYIGMHRRFWRVNRHDDRIELEELGRGEWKSVELFVHTSCHPSYCFPIFLRRSHDDWLNLF